MQFWKNDNNGFDVDTLIETQNKNILEVDPNPVFTYNSLVKRKDGLKTKIRIAEIKTYPALEVTGFIQFEEYILFIVLFTSKELLNKNLRKLQYLLKVASNCKLDFDNHAVIKQQLAEIKETDDGKKQADKYYQVGIWYQEMDDFDNAFINFKRAIECFPTHYSHLKGIIEKALSFDFIEESKLYASQLFEIEPINPTVPKDLIEIYLNHKKPEILIELFNGLIDKNKNIEVLGNLNFHLGVLYFNIDKEKDSTSSIAIAKEHFEMVLNKDHHVFKSIAEFERIKNNA